MTVALTLLNFFFFYFFYREIIPNRLLARLSEAKPKQNDPEGHFTGLVTSKV